MHDPDTFWHIHDKILKTIGAKHVWLHLPQQMSLWH